MAPAPTPFADVLVLHRSDVGWLCEIEDRHVFIGQLQIEPGTNVPSEGQRGTVTIAAHAVADIRDAIRRAGRRPPVR